MSNLIFPTLPGASIDVKRSPSWQSTVQRSVSGRALGVTAYTYPLWKYRVSFEFLRAGAVAELEQIVGFFNKHRGRTDTWLFFDEDDYLVTGQQIGLGDGVTTSFQLVRSYGGFVEPISEPKQFDSMTVGGVETPLYSHAGGGRILFAAAPGAGQPIVWGGQFYRRCRFDQDALDTEKFLYRLWRAKSVDFTTEKG